MPIQRLIGLQVIDTKGSLVGNVKEVFIDFANKDISLKVETKGKVEMDFVWNDLQSVEDVVLLKKQVELSPSSPEDKSDSTMEHTSQTFVICPTCGASSPARAKFCAKCGMDLRS